MKDVFSIVFNSLPSKFLDFIKWVAEVRRQEDDGKSLSQEEKERLSIKEELLKAVQDIDLFKHVTDFLLSGESCCKGTPSMNEENSFPDIAASVCCQGAGILEGNCGSSDGFCCRETHVNHIESNGDTLITVVSGTVVKGNNKQRVNVLVPSSPTKRICCDSDPASCIGIHPATNDVLTVLLLALPPQTWSGIKNQQLLQEIDSLVSTENLSTLLQEEVLHLRGQLLVLKRCKDEKVEEELGYATNESGVSQRQKAVKDTSKSDVQRSNRHSKLQPVIGDDHDIKYPSKLVVLLRQGARAHCCKLGEGYAKPTRAWGGFRFMTTCPRSMMYASCISSRYTTPFSSLAL